MFNFPKNFGLRKIIEDQPSFYLTFDDGPDPKTTPEVLYLLKQTNTKATFFVVGQQAKKYREILKQIQSQGHAIGNHSSDHGYANFFASDEKLKTWIQTSHSELAQMLGELPVGFRSPAGVVTPPLKRVLTELTIPLILWNQRFFDTVVPFSPGRGRRAAQNLKYGDIVLLHDGHCRWPATFRKGVTAFLESATTLGFTGEKISREKTLIPLPIKIR